MNVENRLWTERLSDLRQRVLQKDYALLVEAGDALDAVLALHDPITYTEWYQAGWSHQEQREVTECRQCHGHAWPCKTVQACGSSSTGDNDG